MNPLPSQSRSIGVMSFRSGLLFFPPSLSSPPARPSTGRRRRRLRRMRRGRKGSRWGRKLLGRPRRSPFFLPSVLLCPDNVVVTTRQRRPSFQTRERSEKEERRQSVSAPTPPPPPPLARRKEDGWMDGGASSVRPSVFFALMEMTDSFTP